MTILCPGDANDAFAIEGATIPAALASTDLPMKLLRDKLFIINLININF
jgi:hypothetical protein